MDNDPETEEVYAANEAPVDTVDGGTAGATETEEVGATDVVPADIINATNVAAADGVEVFMEAATAEDDQTEDISSLDLEERREAMQRKEGRYGAGSNASSGWVSCSGCKKPIDYVLSLCCPGSCTCPS